MISAPNRGSPLMVRLQHDSDPPRHRDLGRRPFNSGMKIAAEMNDLFYILINWRRQP